MNNKEKQMNFSSSKYSRPELEKLGVIAFKRVTCRNTDLTNPHFVNYHLYDLVASGYTKPRGNDTYIIESKRHEIEPDLSIIEILIFLDKNFRDRFALLNKDDYKMKIGDNLFYEPIILTYMN
jgi:hypothetical protein